MPRTTHILAAALATLAIVAPAASADPRTDDRIGTSSLAGTTSPAGQDLREPDRRDAAALAQERYYSSYGEPEPLTPPAGAAEVRSRDGIAPLPFILAVSGALIVGLAIGSALQLLLRRRHAAGMAT